MSFFYSLVAYQDQFIHFLGSKFLEDFSLQFKKLFTYNDRHKNRTHRGRALMLEEHFL